MKNQTGDPMKLTVETSAAAAKICSFDVTPLEWMQAFFPTGFDFIAEAEMVGVKILRAWAFSPPGLAAYYVAETEEIGIDPGIDWADMAARLNHDYPGLGVTTLEDARAFMFLHECGHALHREQILKMRVTELDCVGSYAALLNNLIAVRDTAGDQLPEIDDQIAVCKNELAADSYATERFRKWKEEK